MTDRGTIRIECLICEGRSAEALYEGPIRTGRFGSYSSAPARVLRCTSCNAAFLESAPSIDYESEEYRRLVDGGSSIEDFRRLHDPEQVEKLRLLDPARLRGAVVADIGCGAGSLLDLVRGVAARTVAVEPARQYHEALRAAGHDVLSYCNDAPPDIAGNVDVACCFSVIEHVSDPVQLLRDAGRLLERDGELVVTTPNADDWLLDVLPETYPGFFYRAVHRWYFDAAALRSVAAAAGFDSVEVRFVHRYDLANLLVWLRDRRPSGMGSIAIGAPVDAAFCRWLEETGRSDYLMARMKRTRIEAK